MKKAAPQAPPGGGARSARTALDGPPTLGILYAYGEPDPSETWDRRARRELSTAFDRLGLEWEARELRIPQPLGAAPALALLEAAVRERVTEPFTFVIVVTGVDLDAKRQSFVEALPSAPLNVGIVSTSRLERTRGSLSPEERLVQLVLHVLESLVGRRGTRAGTRAGLPAKLPLVGLEIDDLRAALAAEPADLRWPSRAVGRSAGYLLRHLGDVLRGVRRARPLEIAYELRTLGTIGLSLIMVMFFSAEVWDLGGAMTNAEAGLWLFVTAGLSTWFIFRRLALRRIWPAHEVVTGSVVLTSATAFIALGAATLLVGLGFAMLTMVGSYTIFPADLIESWSTVRAADDIPGRLRLAFFLAGMGVLAGSLALTPEDQRILRHILFIDDEV
jgi:hypothetical protein